MRTRIVTSISSSQSVDAKNIDGHNKFQTTQPDFWLSQPFPSIPTANSRKRLYWAEGLIRRTVRPTGLEHIYATFRSSSSPRIPGWLRESSARPWRAIASVSCFGRWMVSTFPKRSGACSGPKTNICRTTASSYTILGILGRVKGYGPGC